MRATEIETFQRQSVILPNSELINGAVGNWTHRAQARAHRDTARKLWLTVTDARSEVMRCCWNWRRPATPLVLKNPEPFVAFTAFAQTSMNFEIRVFLGGHQ